MPATTSRILLNRVTRRQSNAPVKFTHLSAGVRRIWKRELSPLLITGLVIFSVRSSFADWNNVPTGSMKPNILEGDRIFVNKLAYDLKVPFTTWHLAEWDDPERGDVVVDASVLRHEADIAAAAQTLQADLASIDGAIVENKRWTISVHSRLVADANVARLQERSQQVASERDLRILDGKKIVMSAIE